MVDVACLYNMNCSTTAMVLKNKDKPMEHVKSCTLVKSIIISKKHRKVVEEIEKFINVWMQVQYQH